MFISLDNCHPGVKLFFLYLNELTYLTGNQNIMRYCQPTFNISLQNIEHPKKRLTPSLNFIAIGENQHITAITS